MIKAVSLGSDLLQREPGILTGLGHDVQEIVDVLVSHRVVANESSSRLDIVVEQPGRSSPRSEGAGPLPGSQINARIQSSARPAVLLGTLSPTIPEQITSQTFHENGRIDHVLIGKENIIAPVPHPHVANRQLVAFGQILVDADIGGGVGQ